MTSAPSDSKFSAIPRTALRWLAAGLTPTPAQLRTASRMMRRQSAITVAPWVLTAAILVPLNLNAGAAAVIVITR